MSIVGTVMDDLTPTQLAPDCLFHHQPVLVNTITPYVAAFAFTSSVVRSLWTRSTATTRLATVFLLNISRLKIGPTK